MNCVGQCRYQKRVSNIIDDVLEWSPRLALSGMMEKQQTVVNATNPDPNTAENPASDSTGPDSIPDQSEPEIIDHVEHSDQYNHDDDHTHQ